MNIQRFLFGLFVIMTSSLGFAPPSAAQATSTVCAVEDEFCAFEGTREVRFGVSGHYATKTLSGGTYCTYWIFGDPAPGQRKACEILSGSTAPNPTPIATPTPPPIGNEPTASFCANENDFCAFSGQRQVRFGVNGQYVTRTLSGGTYCTYWIFGDPAPGQAKICELVNSGNTTPPAATPTATPTATPAATPFSTPTATPVPASGQVSALVKQGPVLALGTGTDFDAGMMESPNGIFDPQTNQWIMVYTGYDSHHVASIGLATALQPEGPWIKRGQILKGNGSGGDATGMTGPVINYENGVYYLHYIGLNGGAGYESGNTGIYLATSTSLYGPYQRQGVQITSSSAAVWRTNTVWHINIVNRNTIYYAFFNAGNNTTESIGYATAPSLSGPWTVDDVRSPLLERGAPGAWDAGLIGDPYVYKIGNLWYMAYFGVNKDFAQGSDGVAVTSDAEFPLGWKKVGNQPVLSPGGQYTFDGKLAYKPWIVNIGTKHFHFYSATSSEGVPSIGLAIGEIR